MEGHCGWLTSDLFLVCCWRTKSSSVQKSIEKMKKLLEPVIDVFIKFQHCGNNYTERPSPISQHLSIVMCVCSCLLNCGIENQPLVTRVVKAGWMIRQVANVYLNPSFFFPWTRFVQWEWQKRILSTSKDSTTQTLMQWKPWETLSSFFPFRWLSDQFWSSGMKRWRITLSEQCSLNLIGRKHKQFWKKTLWKQQLRLIPSLNFDLVPLRMNPSFKVSWPKSIRQFRGISQMDSLQNFIVEAQRISDWSTMKT